MKKLLTLILLMMAFASYGDYTTGGGAIGSRHIRICRLLQH